VSVFGGSGTVFQGPSAGGWLGGSPPETAPVAASDSDENPTVTWARNVAAILKREKQQVTEEQNKAINLYRGGTPWWRHRPTWKIGTRLNKCATVPMTWAAILCDNKPRVSYAAYRIEDQQVADILTAGFTEAYERGRWQQIIHNCVLLSRVQKKAFLRLVPDPFPSPGREQAQLVVVSGDQVYADANASCVDDAEIVLYEKRESYGSITARFPDVVGKLRRKHGGIGDATEVRDGEILSPPTTLDMPTGATVNNPPYAASPNPPDGSGGTGGMKIQEFWTRPHKKITVSKVKFTASGEPATQQKYFQLRDGSEGEPLRRVITEGNVVYELPESAIDILRSVEDAGGIRVHDDDTEALEVITHKVSYPLYPHGRLTVIVDGDILADDRMNPLGYFPFIEIEAYPDGISFWGQSDIDLIADAYESLVRLVSMMLDAANLTANPLWRLPMQSEMSDDDITNAPGAIQREDLVSLRYGKREQGPEMPQYVMALVQFYIGQINELAGLNDIIMGKMNPKGQQSTETVSMQQEAAGVRFKDALHNIDRAMVTLGSQFKELVSRFYTTPVLVQLKNDAGVNEAIPLLGSHLSMPLRVESKPGSMMPNSPTARLSTLLNLTATGKPIVDLPEVWALLQEIGVINSASGIERRIKKEMANPADSWMVFGLPAPGGPPQRKPGSKRSRKKKPAGV